MDRWTLLIATLALLGPALPAAAAGGPGKLPGPFGKPVAPKKPTGVAPLQTPPPKVVTHPKHKPLGNTVATPLPQVDPGELAVKRPPVRGDLSCRRGDPDCNPCTAGVRAQFRRVARGQAQWKSKPWRFEWGTRYSPDSVRPYEAFDEDTDLANALGLSSSHPQAFVRTNAGPAWYAGTHSQHEAGRPGTVFIVQQDADGKKSLAALHRTKTQHPNGLHVLGHYLLFAERPDKTRPDELRVIDIDRRQVRQDITHLVPEDPGTAKSWKQFGGGLGAAKLSDGSYLVISSLPGDRKTSAGGVPQLRFHQFYNLRGNLADPAAATMRFLGAQQFTPTAAVPAKYQFSENLSLVTECGTGDIYGIHSSGDGEGPDGLEGSGYYRLSKLEAGPSGPVLTPIDVFEMSQNTADCHIRSAASVGVGPNGRLEFLCHQYRKDPDPSALNPLSGNITGHDQWRFRAGVPNP
jgi:hypothetical protein